MPPRKSDPKKKATGAKRTPPPSAKAQPSKGNFSKPQPSKVQPAKVQPPPAKPAKASPARNEKPKATNGQKPKPTIKISLKPSVAPKPTPTTSKKAAPKPSPTASRTRAASTKPSPKTTPAAVVGAPSKGPKVPDLRPVPPPKLGDIPWGYGDVRITAMCRDPHWAYAYWEVTDLAIEAAREKLKDPHASLHLRVYDTTHREFNGLNAHHHWDLGIERSTIGYTFRVGRPGSTIHVDVGVRSGNGDFAPIARSGAVEMPRDSMSPNGQAAWSTVFRSSPAFTYQHRYTPRPAPSPAGGPGPGPSGTFPDRPAEFEPVFQHLVGDGWTRNEWTETQMGGRCVRWIKWTGPFVPEKMPFLPLGEKVAFKTVEVVFQGERRVIKYEGVGERIVFGPWRIQLEAIGPKGEKKTIEQWAIRHRWTTEEGHVRVDTPAVLTRILGGRRVVTAKGASEERLAHELWGSEVLVGGASEYRWTGASESLLAGSSETLQFGGSETLLAGGSEWIFQAASESLFQGASQVAQRGASEHRWGGASELYGPGLPGSSENRP